ncbi:MAG: bacillithiol biosynthesis BshC [Planctomycetes bacterium]|nr:bacillithiol biosynthesis BshC [Planctomycetota bacterium]
MTTDALRIRHLPFRRLHSTEIHLRYLEDDPTLTRLLGRRPVDADDLLRRAPLEARRLLPAGALSQAFAAYAERHGAPAAVRDNAARFAQGKTLVVVAGQQPGLFGGPLYTVHKAATAVRLAQALRAANPGLDVVPVFWNHTDDHDLDEANAAWFVNANQDVTKVRLDLRHSGECLRDVAVGHAMESALAAAADLLPHSEYRDQALAIFRPRHPDEHFGDGLARLLFALFGEDGLLVLEPRDLPPQALEVLPRWWESTAAIRSAIRNAIDELADHGIESTLDPLGTLLFERQGNRRQPLSDGETIQRHGTLSPGVLLRPLWQDACLPNLATVVGPGELAYLAIAGPIYKLLGVPQPALVPRASMTLVEPSLAKLLKRFQWDLPDLGEGPERLASSLPSDEQDAAETSLDDLTDVVKSRMGEIANRLREIDANLVAPVERTRGKVMEELQKLTAKVRNARQNRQGTGQRQVRRLCANLRPRGRLQERVLSPLPFLVSHGFALSRPILTAADPFGIQHALVDL